MRGIEYIAVIDRSGNIIGKEEISVCHKNHLLHLGVSIITLDPFNNLVMHLRGKGHTVLKGYMAFFGGHVPYGMSAYEAAVNELNEEMCANKGLPNGLRLCPLFTMNYKRGDNDSEVHHVFAARINSGVVDIITHTQAAHLSEVDKIRIKSLDEVAEEICTGKEKYTGTCVETFDYFVNRGYAEKLGIRLAKPLILPSIEILQPAFYAP